MSLVDFRKTLPSFWTIQLAGWIVYFVVIYVTFLTIAQPENFLSLLVFKGYRALVGFCLTSFVLRSIYKFFENRLSIVRLILLVLLNAVIFGLVWTATEYWYHFLTNPNFILGNAIARGPRIALD